MNLLTFYLAIFAVMFTIGSANASTIEMLNKDDEGNKMVYSQDIARVDVGETITWVPTSKGHNVEMIAGPNGANLPKKSKNSNMSLYSSFDTMNIIDKANKSSSLKKVIDII